MPTLILSPRFTEDSQLLWRAANELGWDVERLASWSVPESLRDLPDPVVYVEALLAPHVAKQLGLRLTEPPDDWLSTLPKEYRLREVQLGTLGEARRHSGVHFVKPPNVKSFLARVYRANELPADFDDATPVLVAEVVAWEMEFRCFVLDRQLRTHSIYLRRGELQKEAQFASTPEEIDAMRRFVDRMLADPRVVLPRAVVLDVGEIEGRGWAAVELNAAWGSGIYGCDPVEVLQVLRESCERIG